MLRECRQPEHVQSLLCPLTLHSPIHLSWPIRNRSNRWHEETDSLASTAPQEALWSLVGGGQRHGLPTAKKQQPNQPRSNEDTTKLKSTFGLFFLPPYNTQLVVGGGGPGGCSSTSLLFGPSQEHLRSGHSNIRWSQTTWLLLHNSSIQ